MSAHTPTPWEVNREEFICHVRDDELCVLGSTAGHFKNKANAAFIVKACNAHEALVADLTDAYQAFIGPDPFHSMARAFSCIGAALQRVDDDPAKPWNSALRPAGKP